MNYRTASGQSALVPAAGPEDFTDIQQVLRKLMSSSKVVQEDAKVVLLNATSTFGLAGKNKTLLQKRNITVINTADAKSFSGATYFLAKPNNKKTASLAALKTVYGKTVAVTTANPYTAQYKTADFIVVLGQDNVAKTP
jgi:hypothetical protein